MEDCPCLQNHITNPIQEATAQSHCSLCWANFWKSMWETYWLTTLKNSILSLPNSGALHMVNPPLELYSLLLITGTDYLTQDLTSALYSLTLVKRSTQSPTDPYYRSSRTLMSICTSWNAWLTHYLRFRHQYVCVNGSSSDILPVDSGVPQGFVLGPLLIIVYVNDVTMIPLSDGTMSLYADNILFYRPIYTHADYHDLQGDVNNLCAWTDGNNLKFNATKCKYMIISRKKHPSYLTLPFLSTTVAKRESIPINILVCG